MIGVGLLFLSFWLTTLSLTVHFSLSYYFRFFETVTNQSVYTDLFPGTRLSNLVLSLFQIRNVDLIFAQCIAKIKSSKDISFFPSLTKKSIAFLPEIISFYLCVFALNILFCNRRILIGPDNRYLQHPCLAKKKSWFSQSSKIQLKEKKFQ